MAKTWNARFGGFGGQGVVLSSIVLGRAAILDGLYACQRASYGAEARGGRCRSEVIISDEEISYPLVDRLQTLVAMSQEAYDSYLGELMPGGLLVVDTSLVRYSSVRDDVATLEIPAARTADGLGNRIVANMVLLGALQGRTAMVSKASLQRSISDAVAPRFHEINLRAVDEGEKLASAKKT